MDTTTEFCVFELVFCIKLHLEETILDSWTTFAKKKGFTSLKHKKWKLPTNSEVCNLGQNIWNKLEKYRKTEQDKKSLIPAIACYFECYCQSLVSGRNTGC